MTDEKKVTVIIPLFNVYSYAERCIRSLSAQTYENIEILVVDDGSTDDVSEIVYRLAEEDERIYLVSETNKGVSGARNTGLNFAGGDYVTFVDGDDFVGETYIEDLVECAKEHHAELVICGYTPAGTDGTIRHAKRVVPGIYKRFDNEEWAIRMSAVCSRLYARDLIERYHMRFDESDKHVRGEDIPFSLFFSVMCDKIAVLQKADYYYVSRSDSATKRFRGLREIKLPYRALVNTVKKINALQGPVNSADFYEWFVLRILCTFIDLSRGAEIKEIRHLEYFITRLLTEYFPGYATNKIAQRLSGIDVPVKQQAAVRVLTKAMENGKLRQLLTTFCRPK